MLLHYACELNWFVSCLGIALFRDILDG